MIRKEQGLKLFEEKWLESTDDRSEFARRQTPFMRQGWLMVKDYPVKLLETLLNGIDCETIAAGKPAHAEQPKAKNVGWLFVLPAPMCGVVGSFLPIPDWANALVMAAAAAGCAFAAFRQSRAAHRDEPTAEQTETIAGIQASALLEARILLQKEYDVWMEYLHSIEEDAKLGHDVTKDRAFGQWVQKFVSYAARHEEDRSVQVLKDELMDELSNMGITVYDELVLNEEGIPALPDETYYVDEREGEEYTKVKRAVVYSRRRLLAQGKIK